MKIKTEGASDVYVVYNRIVPGGNTGWHSHPGPSIVSVKSGTATEYHAEDPAAAPRLGELLVLVVLRRVAGVARISHGTRPARTEG